MSDNDQRPFFIPAENDGMYLAAAIIRPMGIDDTVSELDLKKISKKKFHEMSMHQHQWEGVLKNTVRAMGHKLTGGMGHCNHCERRKTPKKAISKEVDN